MPRPQEFDTAAVIRRVRDVFWDMGFDATSIPGLEKATGLNRSSLYNAFGSKRGLFDAAVQDYLDDVVRPGLRVLTDGEPEAAVRYFEDFAEELESLPDDQAARGCLLLNSAAGFAAHDDVQRAAVDSYRTELASALRCSLRDLDSSSPVALLEHRTRVLTALSISALLLSRINRDEAVALARTAVEQLRQWQPE